MSETGFASEEDRRARAEIAAALDASNLARAFRVADDALARGGRDPVFFNARGVALEADGHFQEAMAEFEQAHRLAPENANIVNAIGLCLLRLERFREAAERFDLAIALDPTSALAHYRKGWVLAQMGAHHAAKQSYERAVEIEPEYADALACLATSAIRDGHYAQARAYAERSLALVTRQPTAMTALAQADLAEKQFGPAEKKLRSVLADPSLSANVRAVIRGLLADSLDGQERVSEAFNAYALKNEGFRKSYVSRHGDAHRVTDTANALTACFEHQSPAHWLPPADSPARDGSPACHAFLVGFVRSGTTLVERVLASHPDAVTLEEREILDDIAAQFLTSEEGVDRLATLDSASRERLSGQYWERVAAEGLDVGGKVFVDKLPLNLVKLPLIVRLFPKAKILFAIRDPRDIVFSGFRRHFETNAAMFELLRLEDGARLYDAVMRLMAIYREKIGLPVHAHRYEDVVDDFDGQIRAICDFLGLPWNDRLRDFSETARNQQMRSPSAPQVRRELYREGKGQWRRYKDQMAPILPILAPWVERFGYPAD